MINRFNFDNYRIMERALSVPWHPKLIELNLCFVTRYSYVVVVTSAYRPKKIHVNDSGIHGTIPLRADDLSSVEFDDPEGIRDDMNSLWIYDPERPQLKVCVYHDVGFGPHFHLQVHDNTRRREEYNGKI